MSSEIATKTPGRATSKSKQVRQFLVELIGGLEPHARMPTERDLAEKFGTTRLTIRRVLDQLDNEGRVYRTQGAGTFVSEPRISKSVELTSFSADMRARGLVPGSLNTSVEVVAAGARVGAALQISPRDQVIHITRTRTADDVPMALEHCYMPLALVPGLENRVWGGSLYEVLVSEYGLQAEKAEQTIQATVLDEADAKSLSVPPFSAAFLVQRVTIDARGRRMEFALSTYRADRYSYDMIIYRKSGNT